MIFLFNFYHNILFLLYMIKINIDFIETILAITCLILFAFLLFYLILRWDKLTKKEKSFIFAILVLIPFIPPL